MKDLKDLETADLALPPKLGRPRSGNALSNSEKQKAYRERNKLSGKKVVVFDPANISFPLDADAEYRLKCYQDTYGAEIKRLNAALKESSEALNRASLGWPEVLAVSTKAHLNEEIWRLKCAQLVRVINAAGLELPKGDW